MEVFVTEYIEKGTLKGDEIIANSFEDALLKIDKRGKNEVITGVIPKDQTL